MSPESELQNSRRSFMKLVAAAPLFLSLGARTPAADMPPVRKAAEAASHFFIDLFELQAAVGRHLAKMSGAESGMITSGSAGSISCATAGCIAGSDPRNIYQLPD